MTSARRPIALASGVIPETLGVAAVEAAARGGWDGVGLWVDGHWTDRTTVDVRRALADAGIPAVDVEVLWIKPGPPDPEHVRILEVGAAVGARNALCVSSDPDRGATIAKYAALCAHARTVGMRVSLEFGLFTEVKTIDAALSIIDASGDPGAALLVDPLHLARSGGTPADVAAVPRERFAYAQFCDAPATGPRADDPKGIIEEAVDGRLQCGEGALPLPALLDALPGHLWLAIELRSRALREGWPDPVERARVTAEATRRFLAGG
jgi:sugar phosphate isomerase/epimerase